jgi:hypothetical protein
MTDYNYPTSAVSRAAVLKAVHVLPWVLNNAGKVVNPDGSKPMNLVLQRVRFTNAQLKLELEKRNPKEKMKIIKYGTQYHLQSKTGEVHSARYRTRDDAHLAAIKISKGLIHFTPTTARVSTSTNYSNQQ